MKKRDFALALFFSFPLAAVSGCESYGPDDFAAGVACGARQNACEDQCEKEYEITGNGDRFFQCREACVPSQETVCR
ncbi:MAG: hypothetical protein AAFR21_06475 [Pseudomonadota bacterium]